MLGKLLKYDLRYIYKYWWIAAVASFAASFLGAGCIKVMESDRQLPSVVETMAIIGMILVIIAFVAFAIFGMVIAFIRFYRNLFTDEGYLTFTLPAKISDIIGAKLIAGTLTVISSTVMLFVDVFLMLWITYGEEVPEMIGDFIEDCFEQLGFYFPLYVLEIIAIGVAFVVFGTLFSFICISISRMVIKKARVITAIGIYYLASNGFSFMTQIVGIFGSQAVSTWLADMPENEVNITVSLILLAMFLISAIIGTVLYIIQHKILQSKLNLA